MTVMVIAVVGVRVMDMVVLMVMVVTIMMDICTCPRLFRYSDSLYPINFETCHSACTEKSNICKFVIELG